MTRKISLAPPVLVAVLAVLTLVVPVMQWLVGKLIASSQYSGLISNIPIILCVCLWYWKTKAFSLLPSSSSWKIFCYLVGVIVCALLIINILNQPVSKITGQARSPFEVVDVIILGPSTEELVFRGVMWSIFERLSKNGRWSVVALVGTSLLFSVEHLGYWAQFHWPLPRDAIIHSLSMVVAGACFGALRMATRSLAAPTVVHMAANGVILLTQ